MADNASILHPASLPGLPAYTLQESDELAGRQTRFSRAVTVVDEEDESVHETSEENDDETGAEALSMEANPQHLGRYAVSPRYMTQGDKGNVSLRTGKFPQKLATFHELRSDREHCGFCDLAFKAMKRYGRSTVTGNTQCFLTWEVDGRAEQFVDGVRNVVNKSRRLKLSWGENENSGQVYLVLAVPDGAPGSSRSSQLVLWQGTHSLGRELSDQTEKQALMRDRDFLKLIDETYFGVIDVLDMQLKPLPVRAHDDGTRYSESYVALSYVWGKGSKQSRYVTTGSTILTHIRPGGLAAAWAKLPRTIQDAILLVSRLGERYLWVDSLCIAQDNERAWENNAKAMHLIYGNAYFTICAADGDAESGLRADSVSVISRTNMGTEAKAFTMDECPVWTYYVPKERGESQWDLFYVLLLERDEEHCWWERVALGKVFKAAFENADWAETQLN
ncbi:hypothetical protein VPNG_03029 [Cytospora leucostoma]|uniref:Heterokaryon incompatibility domain-containing protein n=1 Tax=Cytospora leucostoma TaxID=1230097 RepID=A0A423XG10_9PEZI|nr:hypothetical protein VPNG_03029 [Cytospora leucostoma]